jgi:hypothetical protein
MGDPNQLRAIHPCVLDMRVGGARRVRTNLCHDDFGYLSKPKIRGATRELLSDYLMDIEVRLLAVEPPQPSRMRRYVLDPIERMLRREEPS